MSSDETHQSLINDAFNKVKCESSFTIFQIQSIIWCEHGVDVGKHIILDYLKKLNVNLLFMKEHNNNPIFYSKSSTTNDKQNLHETITIPLMEYHQLCEAQKHLKELRRICSISTTFRSELYNIVNSTFGMFIKIVSEKETKTKTIEIVLQVTQHGDFTKHRYHTRGSGKNRLEALEKACKKMLEKLFDQDDDDF